MRKKGKTISGAFRKWLLIIVANEDWEIVSDRRGGEGEDLSVTGIRLDPAATPQWTVFSAAVYGQDAYCMYTFTEGYYIISVMPENEVVLSRDTSVAMTAAMDVLVFVALFAVIVVLVRRLVMKNIDSVNDSLSRITGGDLDVVVDVRDNVEFSALSDDINSTVTTLKRYIAEAAARIDQELEFARAIQISVLSRTFPAFPERTDFDIYATMEGLRFREHEFELRVGDTLFVYTDGVAEATDANNELFGTERMLAALNRDPAAPPETLLPEVRRAIDAFVGDAPQFDDITMLCLRYDGHRKVGPLLH